MQLTDSSTAASLRDHYDCLVVGGGPAGSTAAALIAGAGHATLLLEREQFPRPHVGESLMPETYWTLKRLGVVERLRKSQFTPKEGVQFIGPSGRESQPFLFEKFDPRESSRTWHVERAEFDNLLFQNASEQGADCLDQTRLLKVTLSDAGGHHKAVLRDAAGAEHAVTARVIVDATGQQAFLANRLNLKVDNPKLHKAAIWGYYRSGKRQGLRSPEVTAILHTDSKHSWFWYIPLSGDVVSVGLVGDSDQLLQSGATPAEVFEREVRRSPGLVERLEGAAFTGQLNVAKEFSYTTSRKAGDGWVLVGDAGGFIDPIYSTGVFLALKSGELAADCVDEGLRIGDVSGKQLGKWGPKFEAGVTLFRKMVEAFYTPSFRFASFVEQYPEHRDNLTGLLIGRAFDDNADRIFHDLDPILQKIRADNDAMGALAANRSDADTQTDEKLASQPSRGGP